MRETALKERNKKRKVEECEESEELISKSRKQEQEYKGGNRGVFLTSSEVRGCSKLDLLS